MGDCAMTSIIKADNISTVSGSGNITIPTGVKVVGTDAASIVAPGQIIQFVQAETSNLSPRPTITSTSYVDSGYSLSITPKFSTSKIYCNFHASAHCGGGSYLYGMFRRNGTGLSQAEFALGSANQWEMIGMNFIDSPSSTSAVTYTLAVKVSGSTGYLGWTGSYSSPNTNMQGWTLMEIAQ